MELEPMCSPLNIYFSLAEHKCRDAFCCTVTMRIFHGIHQILTKWFEVLEGSASSVGKFRYLTGHFFFILQPG